MASAWRRLMRFKRGDEIGAAAVCGWAIGAAACAHAHGLQDDSSHDSGDGDAAGEDRPIVEAAPALPPPVALSLVHDFDTPFG